MILFFSYHLHVPAPCLRDHSSFEQISTSISLITQIVAKQACTKDRGKKTWCNICRNVANYSDDFCHCIVNFLLSIVSCTHTHTQKSMRSLQSRVSWYGSEHISWYIVQYFGIGQCYECFLFEFLSWSEFSLPSLQIWKTFCKSSRIFGDLPRGFANILLKLFLLTIRNAKNRTEQ